MTIIASRLKSGSRLYLAVTLTTLLSVPVAFPQAPPAADQIVTELREQHTTEALHDADQALVVTPNDVRLLILKGLAADQLSQPAVALRSFEAALRIAPASLPALEGASEVAFRIDRPAARVFVRRLLALIPEDPNANGMAGMLDVEDRQWSAAAEHFGKAGTSIATQRSALDAQVLALDNLGREAEAEAVVQHILELSPGDTNARCNLAILQLRQKRPSDALATVGPLVSASNETALSLAAAAYEALGDTPNAVASLRGAIQQNPKDPQNYLDFAGLSFDHTSFPAGIAVLNAGIAQLPDSAALHVARGALYMQSSQVDLADQDFEAANRLDPTQSFGLEAQGLTEMQRHNLPEALSKVKASLQKAPGSGYLNYLAAEILKEAGAAPNSPEAAEAIRYAEHAIALDSSLLPARDLLSGLQFQAGDFLKAADQCRAALKQDPMDQEAIFRLILALKRTGDKEHEIPGLLEHLKQAKAQEHTNQVRVDKYHLSEAPAPPPPRTPAP